MTEVDRAAALRVAALALELLSKSKRPSSLQSALDFCAGMEEVDTNGVAVGTLISHIGICGPNDDMLHRLTMMIQAWDHQPDTGWARGTASHTALRRELIVSELGLGAADQEVVNRRVPRFSTADVPVVVAKAHEPWYSENKSVIRSFYWDHYLTQLRKPHGSWDGPAVAGLSVSIDDVLARLSDPSRTELYPVKGLVMGYVQSGKTSHFSGLIAKAVDAGYRLIIVLAGTLDILRRQTQRRIDKEIVGSELLGDEEYGNDSDWNRFVHHGGRPVDLGYFDWDRLTNRDDDYRTLRQNLGALEFARVDRTKPFNHPDNLRAAPAKLAVIKKVPTRIRNLCKDLTKLAELRNALEHVPTLIIDDESDQASINTIDPRKPSKSGPRTATSDAIASLLRLLPRAQYVGYTATPFANVFIDPDNADELFPKDFIVSLPRPTGYMGVSDFFDFDEKYEEDDFRGNRNAFVRPVSGTDVNPANLPAAIDAFVLSGALKLFREASDPHEFRYKHHTMLIHNAAKRMVHEVDRTSVEEIFGGGARYQRQDGLERLKKLFQIDYLPVSRTRAPEAPFPATFEELRPFVARCISRICSGAPVRVVNGDDRNRDDTPDFDQEDVWAILVGGTKLSRGYTVEGLTVSYYRRTTGAGDTLMQMGRWFGFRHGYRDLVRLFIGNAEQKGRNTVNLYDAFGAVCRDEEALRADLRKYAAEGLLPVQVPPLVRQHLSTLPPTSRNKMFNAEIKSQDFAGDWTEKTTAPSESADMKQNLGALGKLLDASKLAHAVKCQFELSDRKRRRVNAIHVKASGRAVLAFLAAYKWADRDAMRLERSYIAEQMSASALGNWVVLLPQLANPGQSVSVGAQKTRISVIERSRIRQRFGVYSDPGHRAIAAFIAGTGPNLNLDPALNDLGALRHPVLMVYLVAEPGASKEDVVSVGFGIQYPGVKRDKALVWTVRDKSRPDAIVVKAEGP